MNEKTLSKCVLNEDCPVFLLADVTCTGSTMERKPTVHGEFANLATAGCLL